jgi:hypothetical protein
MLTIQLNKFKFSQEIRDILNDFIKDYDNLESALNDIKKHIESNFCSGGLLWWTDYELVKMYDKIFSKDDIKDFTKIYIIKSKIKTIATNFIKGI